MAICNAPAAGGRVEELINRCFSLLQLEAGLRDVRGKLQPDSRYLLTAGFDSLSKDEAFKSSDHALARWQRIGQRDLLAAAADTRPEFRRSAVKLATDFVTAAGPSLRSVPELVALLRETLLKVDERLTTVRQQSEELAAYDLAALVKQATAKVQASGFLGGRTQRQALRQAVNRLVEASAEREILKIYEEACLMPLRQSLAETLESVEALTRELTLAGRQLEQQLPELAATIGFQNAFSAELVTDEDLPDTLARLEQQVSARMGALPPLNLTELLDPRRTTALAEVLERRGEALRTQALEFFHREMPNLNACLEHLGLDFDLAEWLGEALQQLTLPAKLDLGAFGPANHPLQVYLVEPASLKDPLMAVVQDSGNPLGVEYCISDNPYEVILRAKISRAPFRSLPGLDCMESAYQEFVATAPKDHVWGTLISHDALSAAHHVNFWGADV